MDLLDRIKLIMKSNQMNAASFADRIGVQRSSVSHIINGRNKPSLDFVEKILKQFPKVNASWLITGHIQQTDIIHPEIEEGTISHQKEKSQIVTGVTAGDSVPKRIIKIITFYEDFTFDEYRPGK